MRYKNVTCPHCGLLCDDIAIESDNKYQLEVKSDLPGTCQQAITRAFTASDTAVRCAIAGKSCSLSEALDHAASLLGKAKLSLVSGLIADVATIRGAVELSDRTGAVIDHGDSDGLMANVSAMQRYGTITSTLAEVRNRADCVIVLGNAVFEKFPRFLDRILFSKKTLSPDLKQHVYVIDLKNQCDEASIDHPQITQVPVETENLDQAVQILMYALSDQRVPRTDRLEMAARQFSPIIDAIKSSSYCVFAWSTSEFSEEMCELTVQNLNACIKNLSERQRCVGLPLGSSKSQITANQVCTWQSGLPLRTRFSQHIPEHNQKLYSANRLLAENEVDTLVWIAVLHPDDTPPRAENVIVIGHPTMTFEKAPDVFIAVAVPGVDTAGLVCRTDNVATLPLQKIRDIGLPTAQSVMTQLVQRLPQSA